MFSAPQVTKTVTNGICNPLYFFCFCFISFLTIYLFFLFLSIGKCISDFSCVEIVKSMSSLVKTSETYVRTKPFPAAIHNFTFFFFFFWWDRKHLIVPWMRLSSGTAYQIIYNISEDALQFIQSRTVNRRTCFIFYQWFFIFFFEFQSSVFYFIINSRTFQRISCRDSFSTIIFSIWLNQFVCAICEVNLIIYLSSFLSVNSIQLY